MSRQCWAQVLGKCDGGLSKEHVFSRSLFEGSVLVKGLGWCRENFKDIGPNGLTSNVLCVKHNNGLSELDQGAKLAIESILEASRLSLVRLNCGAKRRWRSTRFKIDRVIFARWSLKTLANVSQVQKQPWAPDIELVNIIYGNAPISPAAGLAVLGEVNDKIAIGRSFMIEPIHHLPSRDIQAVRIGFGGINAICSWKQPLAIMAKGLVGYAPENFIGLNDGAITFEFNGNVRLVIA